MTLGALGVVFGDIGTSPLYTLSECFRVSVEQSGRAIAREEILGLLSLIFWALTLVVTVKYLLFILRADNHGEGGILALLAIIPEKYRMGNGGIGVVAALVIVGAALLYGDGAITPAISVLSAMEGIGVARPALARFVVPLTVVILVLLFAIQSRGTTSIGRFFGPIMMLWFVAIGALGAWHIAKEPSVLAALSPHYGFAYLATHGPKGPLILGSVVLAVTGGEALYADMGHFGRTPIRTAWLAIVKPALILCYFGQGALVIAHPEAVDNPFFALVSGEALTFALVILSSAATVIASQALISGAYSLTRQAMQLGFMPRMTVKHTAVEAEGQIYVPEINWLLMIVCVVLVIAFGKSARLAAAYGIAVTGTMGITSVVYYVVARRTWKWPFLGAFAVLLLFLSFDLPFFATNLFKFFDGGYVPIAIAAVITVLMLIWSRGRRLLREHLAQNLPAIDNAFPQRSLIARVPGTAVFLSSSLNHVPPALARQVEKNRVLHENVLLVGVTFEAIPYVDKTKRSVVRRLAKDVHVVELHFGYMQTPRVVPALEAAAKRESLPFDRATATYYLGRETILAGPRGKMGRLTETLFAFLQRNAVAADRTFGIPPAQVVEIGSQVDL